VSAAAAAGGESPRRLRVMTIVGTRPELIKLSRVIGELDSCVEHVLVHTGQNFDYELNGIFFRDLGIRTPDHFLEVAGDNPAQTIARIIERADRVIGEVQPDAVLIYGDTNSCLAVIAAKRRKVPIFHMEAGNRCFDQRVPEEINRKLVDHLSDVNMPLTEHARRYLLAEGLRPELVIRTGSAMREVLQYYGAQIDRSEILRALQLEAQGYFVVSAHREENVDDPRRLAVLVGAIAAATRRWNKRAVFSTHPRTRARLEQADLSSAGLPIEFLKPLGFCDYIQLQRHAFCVLSDSGTLTEEAALLGFPGVMLREAHERPEGMDAGVTVMSGVSEAGILRSIDMITSQALRLAATSPCAVADYASERVSVQVARVIQSYTEYVNRVIWQKV
jgi:UDP-N-acetylglucosamine 2-epimerase